ncbi:MAG: NUDIX hydrolase [Chitinivibrionales bacterium]
MKSTIPKKAAVSVVVLPSPDPQFLILKRAIHPDDPWSGHYAFPGGGYEPHDGSMLNCAIRETQEECGLHLSPRQLVRELPVKIAGNYLGKPVSVYPFIFHISRKPRLCLHPREVAEVEWLSRSYIENPSNRTSRAFSPRYEDRQFPCIVVPNGYVWGFTYELLMQVVELDGP